MAQDDQISRLDPDMTLNELRRGMAAMRELRVAVVGETIIDEYAYCDVIGKSGKEPNLVSRFINCEAQAGGVLAIANHLAEFCARVELVSGLGEFERREDFVRGALSERVYPNFVTKPGSPTIVKRRYLDSLTKHKLLGVYQMNSQALPDSTHLCQVIEAVCARVDLVVVADYGHGLISRQAIAKLCERAPYLAINTQLNADNHGYNVISKYPWANFVCVHEGELRLDARSPYGPIDSLLAAACGRMKADAVMATRGKHGTLVQASDGQQYACPAFARKVVERVGAGDAVLSLSSLAMAAGLGIRWASVLGNLAGAQAVAVVGNSAAIRRSALMADAEQLFPERRLRPVYAGVQ